MKVKHYRAENMPAAINMVKRDLGTEAIILSTKTVRTGIGSGRKPLLEVSAALPSKAAQVAPQRPKASPAAVTQSYQSTETVLKEGSGADLISPSEQKSTRSFFRSLVSQSGKEKLSGNGKAMGSSTPQIKEPEEEEKPAARELLHEVKSVTDELVELRKVVQALKTNNSPNSGQEIFAQLVDIRESLDKAAKLDSVERQSYLVAELENIDLVAKGVNDSVPTEMNRYLKEELRHMRGIVEKKLKRTEGNVALGDDEQSQDPLLDTLLKAEVKRSLAIDLVTNVKKLLLAEQLPLKEFGIDVLAAQIMDRIQTTEDLWDVPQRGHVVALVGPTGVGKTTTIAKLAAQQVFDKGNRIAIITLDTFRIGAVDQLNAYAKILGVPCSVAHSTAEFEKLLRVHADKDLILVDTVGISQRDDEMMNQLTEVFQDVPDVEAHLVLSATTRESEARDVLERFGQIPIQSMMITKLDETVSFGALLGFLDETDLPLSYFTIGQKVPEDIETATPERVADMILRISTQM